MYNKPEKTTQRINILNLLFIILFPVQCSLSDRMRIKKATKKKRIVNIFIVCG